MRKRLEAQRCDVCGARSLQRVTVQHEETVTHDGRPQVVRIPDLSVIRCMNPDCRPDHPHDTMILDDDALTRISLETYRQLGLLTPPEIRAHRERLDLTQQELADLLRLGGNSLSRWESGAVYQSRSLDTLLRVVFNATQALEYLRRAADAREEAQSATGAASPGCRFGYLGHSGESIPEGGAGQPAPPRVSAACVAA